MKLEHEVRRRCDQPDKPVGRFTDRAHRRVKKELSGTNIPVLQPARITDRQAIDEIRELGPDVMVVDGLRATLTRGVFFFFLEIQRLND